jgi:hypothetical protein
MTREKALAVVSETLLKIPGASPELVQAVLKEDDFIDGYGGAGWGEDRQPGAFDTELLREKLFATGNEKSYAIRHDDLKFGEECLSVGVEIAKWAPAAAAVALASGGVAVFVAVPAAVAVATAKGLVTLAMRIRKKAADLSDDEFKVLVELLHNGPQSVKSLVFILNGTRLSAPYQWTEENVAALLERLKVKRLRDGSTRALAEKAGDGLWSASGL